MNRAEAMTLKDLRDAIDKAIESVGEDTKVYTNATTVAYPICYPATCLHLYEDKDISEFPFVVLSSFTAESINFIKEHDIENLPKEIYFSKD